MLLRNNYEIIRVLDTLGARSLVIDCLKETMPYWVNAYDISQLEEIELEELLSATKRELTPLSELDAESASIVQQRFTLIAPILNVLSNDEGRKKAIRTIADANNISRRTLRRYLCSYLVFQDKSALAPKSAVREVALSDDEKNFRWALNKYFYTAAKNSLNTAYKMMLAEKYCDEQGHLLEVFPSYYQFRYFYRKSKNIQNFYITREGKTEYQRNHRPLLGDGIQEYAKCVGTGMLDSTVCDIYLVNEEGNVAGRPVLTACVDAYSGLCNGYTLTLEGGVYSLRALMTNIISDKVIFCEEHGIRIERDMWDSSMLPGNIVTDMGSEYKSQNFEQLTELGLTITNLPPYRPELKGAVEKFFDLIQAMFKPVLKGKGVIEPDFRERGAHDYRLDACLTLAEFEKIIIKCIVYYNSMRIVEKFPYTDEMIRAGIQPHSNSIWEWGRKQPGANLISVTQKQIIMTLLPRTTGEFTRMGLIVNKTRYKNEDYNSRYVPNKEMVEVAYDPESTSFVWLVEHGSFVKFELIESRFKDKSFSEAEQLRTSCKELINSSSVENMQAQIDLANFIQTIADSAKKPVSPSIKGIRENRKREQDRQHIDFVEKYVGGGANE